MNKRNFFKSIFAALAAIPAAIKAAILPPKVFRGKIRLTPNALIDSTAYSKKLLNMSPVDFESFVRDDIALVLALEKNRTGINGLGFHHEPSNFLDTTGINQSFSFNENRDPRR